MECCVESDDSGVKFGRHADLLKEAPLELPQRQPGLGRHRRNSTNAVAREKCVRRHSDGIRPAAVARKQVDKVLFH
jgi:hypothetical protein